MIGSMNKSLQFAKNMGIASLTYAAAGAVGSKISGMFSEYKWMISSATTITEFLAGYAILINLHRKDNPEAYSGSESSRNEYKKDTKRLFSVLLGLEPLYFVGRTVLHTYFQNKGYSPLEADLMADSICIPAYDLAAFILAKYCGVIKEN